VSASPDRLGVSPYLRFTRSDWASLRESTPLTLTAADLVRLRGINEALSLEEVADVYLPLSRLLNLYVGAVHQLHQVTDAFLGRQAARVPYVIGIAGSVAVGKSTTARILRELLSRWQDHPRVDLVTTDGFLLPNRELAARNLMHRKGFPESYDLRRLLRFVADIKSGCPEVSAPVYSHLSYDVVPGQTVVVREPDIVIIEGLNVLQTRSGVRRQEPVFVSDYFDFSLFVDADLVDIENWYVQRFLTFRATSFRERQAYFHKYSRLTDFQAEATARSIWSEINSVNLQRNILPTRERADLVLRKGPDHLVTEVSLRKT